MRDLRSATPRSPAPSRSLRIALCVFTALLLFLLAWRIVTAFHQNAVLAGRSGDRIWVHVHRFGWTFARVRGLPDSDHWQWYSAPAGGSGLGMPWIFTGSGYSTREIFADISFAHGPALMTDDSIGGGYVYVSTFTLSWNWVMLLPFLPTLVLLPRYLMLRSRLARRLRGGLCVHCGYVLRGTPQRCPECGAPPGAK